MSFDGGGNPARKKGRMCGFMLTNQAWKQSLIDHHKRMGHIKPTIRFDSKPWGHTHENNKATGGGPYSMKPSKPAAGRPGTAGRNTRPGTAGQSPRSTRSQGGGHQQQQQPHPGHLSMAQDEFGIHSLTPEQQATCRDMKALLVALENQKQSKKIVEEVFVSAEEARLLQGYTGVLPGMEQPKERGANAAGDEEEEGEDEEEVEEEDEEETSEERKEREKEYQRQKEKQQAEDGDRPKKEEGERKTSQSSTGSGGKKAEKKKSDDYDDKDFEKN